MERSTIVGAVAGFAGALVIGTVAVANAGTTGTPTATPTQTPPTSQGAPEPEEQQGDHRWRGGEGHRGGTPVTGAELTKVTAAVTAKAPGVAVTDVRKRPDGSYVARGTKADRPVRVRVTADLSQVDVMGGGGGKHEMRFAEVDAATLAKITAAVTAKDSTIAVEHAVTLHDGSYAALGTKSGRHVLVHVSAAFAVVDVMDGVPGPFGRGGRGHHGPHGQHGQGPDARPGQAPTDVPGGPTASPSA